MMKKAFLAIAVLFYTICLQSEDAVRPEEAEKPKVALLVVATGKYDKMGVEMIASARRHFLPGYQRKFIIFTDGAVPEGEDTVRVEQKRLGWPFDTLKRYHIYWDHRDLIKDADYVFAVDADMIFKGDVGPEILSDLVATEHFGFIGKVGTYCGNKKSKAYVTRSERKKYCCGAFYGGTLSEFLKMLEVNIERVDADLKNKVIPKWHDEAYNNRYWIDHPPTLVLSPSYCYPEGWELPYEPRLISLQSKDTTELRK